ncbi:MAG: glycosyltransferase [Planctomycetes bacterium]|nr:glycosyltransferase [Planctomycetota bacterium]
MILYLINELYVGGAEKSLAYLAGRLNSNRFGRPVVASLWGTGPLADELKKAGIEVISLALHKWQIPLAALRLRRILRSKRFGLLHTFLFHANLVGRLAAIGSGVPVVSSIRVAEEDRPFRVTLDRLTNGLVAAETCVSEAVRQWSIERGLPAEKLITIHNGIDCSAYGLGRGTFRDGAELGPEAKIALFIGRLHRQKGPDILVDVASILFHRRPNLHFVLDGDGPMEAKLRRMAREKGVAERFHLLGKCDDVSQVLDDADMLVLPSRWEGMPNAILEAMAGGVPVVATDVGGCGELVQNGKTGLLVPPCDARALAEAIDAIISDPGQAATMAQAARECVGREFTVEKMVRANEELYERILAGQEGDG